MCDDDVARALALTGGVFWRGVFGFKEAGTLIVLVAGDGHDSKLRFFESTGDS
jgi:hypothetical protein